MTRSPENRQSDDDVRGNAVADIALLGVASGIFERQYCNRWAVCTGRTWAAKQAVRPLDFADEPVAAPGHSPYPLTTSWHVRESSSQSRNLHGEVAFLDGQARPGRVHQRGLADEHARLTNQGPQQDAGTLTERNGSMWANQRVGHSIQSERAKRVKSGHGHLSCRRRADLELFRIF
jgi:hypothetical protein